MRGLVAATHAPLSFLPNPMRIQRSIRVGLVALAGTLALAALGLASWEPLVATVAPPPPARLYDTVIARDRFGVPHVFGRTDPDVAYGVGYAHAEDDFETLQKVFAMVRGRLGALTGSDGAKTDYVLHLLGARETVDRDYDGQPADVRALLDGYASGLNLYAARHPGEVRLARLFPINGRDVATGFVLRSPFFFGLDKVIGSLASDKPLPPESAGPLPDAPDVTPLGVAERGSNGFAVAPRRSADGATRLISNAHQPWTGAAAWYELVVHSGTGWNFAGATFPGVPYPLMGHNRTLGWTNTVNRPDLVDVYRLALDADGRRYRWDGGWRTLERHRVWLPVKLWGPFVLPVPRMVERAVQGPVITGKHGSFAIRYAGANQLGMVEEYYRLTRATDFVGWQRALARQAVPATNFVYADAAGHIGLFYNASFPRRRPGFDYRHILPGNTSRAFTPGTVPWAEVPRNVDPVSGFIVNANDSPFQAAGTGSELDPHAFSPLLGIETDTTNRGRRALELMGAIRAIGDADLLRIKFDTGVSRASWAGRWMRDVLTTPAVTVDGRRAQALLARWHGMLDGRDPGDALASLLMHDGQRWHYQRLPREDPATDLESAAAYLQLHFGRLDPPLGTVLRLRRGAVDLPMDGGPEVLRAAALWDEAPDGRLVVNDGDSFIMAVAWNRAGQVSSRSIVPFGTAATRPASPHYADQASLFVRHRFKPVWFDPADLRRHLERVYRP